MVKDPYYYFQNIYRIFDSIKIGCVDILFEKIKMDFQKDIPFYYDSIYYFSNQHDFLESNFVEFIDYIFNHSEVSNLKVKSKIHEILIDLLKEMTFVESCVILNKQYHFCIDDIADIIRNNESYAFSIEQEFKNKKMMLDSFLSNTNEINIDELDW